MVTLPGEDCSVDSGAVTMRSTWGAQEHQRRDRLVEERHYRRLHGIVSKRLGMPRWVARWVARCGARPGSR